MKNQFNVHFNLEQSKIVTEPEYKCLRLYLLSHHIPNHRGNSVRGIGDIYDLEFVIETHNELENDSSNGDILFCEGFEVIKKLFNDGIAFIEVK